MTAGFVTCSCALSKISPGLNDVIIADHYDGQFVTTSYETTEVRDMILATRSNSNRGRVQPSIRLHTSQRDYVPTWQPR